MEASKVHFSLDAKDVRPLVLGVDYDVAEYREIFRDYGIGMDENDLRTMYNFAMDTLPTIQQGLTTPSIPTLIQFLQNWLPGMVGILTAARQIDELVGIQTTGSWEDEEVVQPVLENTGTAAPYGDTTNVPLTNWNLQFNARTVWRGESGFRVGNLEEARASRQRVNSGDTKRKSCAQQLEIARNQIGFYGYNGGNDSTYGFLNDPALPAFVQVATGVGGYTWAQKTFLEITADIRTALVALRVQSQDTIKPGKTPIKLAIATASVDYLSTTSDFGISVRDWIKQTYPNITIESAPQLNAAHASDNVFYAYAEMIEEGVDMSTDDRRVFIQIVPAKMQTLGVMRLAKGYEEDYSNATAGIMCKRPYAVVRYYDI